MTQPLSRRTLLRGALGLPFLSAMLRPGRSVADAGVPRRLVVVFRPNGVVPTRWFPAGGAMLGASMESLRRHRDDLLVLEGLDMISAIEDRVGRNPHDLGTCHALTARPLRMGPSGRYASAGHLTDGSAGGPSLDQLVASRPGFREQRFPSLTFGVRAGGLPHNPINHAFWRGPFEAVSPMQDPAEAFGRVFTPLAEGADRAAAHAREARLFEGILENVGRLRGRLGHEDQRRLDHHVAAVEVLRGRSGTPPNACEIPAVFEGSDAYRAVGRYHADLATRALACDLTRVIGIQCSTGESRMRFAGDPNHHHGLSHGSDADPGVRSQLAEIDRFYAEELAYLLDGLAETEAEDGSRLLDHTAVLFVNEVGEGRLPFLLAGMPSTIRTGRVLDAAGAAHADLFVAVLRALGLEDETFGEPAHCEGVLPGVLP